jgi:hypothetical protein
VKIEQARAAKVTAQQAAPKTPKMASPPPSSRPPAETPDWLRQASRFLLHHSPMRSPAVPSPQVLSPLVPSPPLPPLEASVAPPAQVAVPEEAPIAPPMAPPPPTSPYM